MKAGKSLVDLSAESLATIRIFRKLPLEARQEIAGFIKGNWYTAGQQIFSQHDHSQDVYLIVSGLVRITFFSLAGKEISFRELSAGDSFGHMAAIDGEVRSATVVAMENTLMVILSSARFWQLLESYPAVNREVLQTFCTLVRGLSERVVEFSTLCVNSRIQAEILRLAKTNMSGVSIAEIVPAPTHQDIANRISTHREAVTREIARLTRSGILKRKSGLLVVYDVPKLERMVCEVSGK